MNLSTTLSEAGVLMRFFRRNSESIADFAAQVKALSPAEKLELAQAVAQQLGLTQDQVTFSLT